MRFRYAFVSPSEEVASCLASQTDPDVEELFFSSATLDQALPVARRLLDEDVDVVIGGGATGTLLAEKLENVVTLERSPFQLLATLHQARGRSRIIGVTSYGTALQNQQLLEELLSIEIRPIVFSTEHELRTGIGDALSDGCKLVVGGGICRDVANELGGHGMLVLPGSDGVRSALLRARRIAEGSKSSTPHVHELRTATELVDEALLVLDGDGRIKFLNAAAETLLRDLYPRQHSGWLSRTLPPELTSAITSTGRPRSYVARVGARHLQISSKSIVIDERKPRRVLRLVPTGPVRAGRPSKPLSTGFRARHQLCDLSGGSSLQAIITRAKRYAAADANILIEGETGTGKELLAQGIHNASERASEPFVAINCSALPESLLESELFGYEEGAFTGARRGGKPGLFEVANQGTLFLDEIADVSPALQAKLLRVLEERCVMRLGGERLTPVDVRILSASQTDLYDASISRAFRSDLYFRLAVLRIGLPPIRDRIEDVEVLLRVLFDRHGLRIGPLSRNLKSKLSKYPWPGNVRELDALVQTYRALSDQTCFSSDLLETIFNERCTVRPADEPIHNGHNTTLRSQVRLFEAAVIERTLAECHFNRSATARKLGVSVNSLWRKRRT